MWLSVELRVWGRTTDQADRRHRTMDEGIGRGDRAARSTWREAVAGRLG